MAASVNVVYLLGNLGRAPELKYSQSGNPVTRLSLATNEYSKDGQSRVEWHNVIVFGQAAEACCKYLDKGSCVHVDGSLRTRSWEKDGEKKYVTEIIARRVQFLDRSGGHRDNNEYYQGNEGYGYQDRPAQQQPAQQAQQGYDYAPF